MVPGSKVPDISRESRTVLDYVIYNLIVGWGRFCSIEESEDRGGKVITIVDNFRYGVPPLSGIELIEDHTYYRSLTLYTLSVCFAKYEAGEEFPFFRCHGVFRFRRFRDFRFQRSGGVTSTGAESQGKEE
jgi:hypothetical protein